jgi:hypothetical protein
MSEAAKLMVRCSQIWSDSAGFCRSRVAQAEALMFKSLIEQNDELSPHIIPRCKDSDSGYELQAVVTAGGANLSIYIRVHACCFTKKMATLTGRVYSP